MYKLLFSLILIGLSGSCASVNDKGSTSKASLDGDSSKGRFFFDDKTGQYYSNKDTAFSIRVTNNEQILSRIEVSVNNEEFRQYKGSIRFSSEGLHIVRFRSVDPVLNWSPIQVFKVYVDATPPRIESYFEREQHRIGNQQFIHSSSVLHVAATDNLAGLGRILIRRGKDGNPEDYRGGMSFTEEGPQVVYVQAVDRVGNSSSWQPIQFTVDNSAPRTQLTVIGKQQRVGDTLFVNNGSKLVLESEDSASGVQRIEYRINNGPVVTYKQPFSIAGDQVILQYRAIDWVENKEDWKTQKVVTDLKAPQINISTNGRHILEAGTYYALPGFTLRAQVKDEESGLAKTLVSINGKAFEPVENLDLVFNDPGSHTLIVRAIDHVGNQEDSNVYPIYIDTKVGDSEIRSARALVKQGDVWLSSLPNSIDIIGNDIGVGIDFVEISYDGNQFTRMAEPIDLARWPSRNRTLHYRAVDRLGNREDTKSMAIRIQTEAPSVDLFIHAEQYQDTPLSDVIRKGRADQRTGH